MYFGELLQRFRKERQYTLRDLGKLIGVDHAYIHRLETGEKSTPSAKIVKALTQALKLTGRQAEILRVLMNHPVPDNLVEMICDEPEHNLTDFKSLVVMSHHVRRPKTTEQWRTLITMIGEVRQEIEINN